MTENPANTFANSNNKNKHESYIIINYAKDVLGIIRRRIAKTLKMT
jgi:hypothetical protein